ncbi:UvrD-helicase domain-containing protein [bacterium]|nr:UvrD-helicase domain-containing protein [bacterium]
MPRIENTAIIASAGTGKTYRLAMRFIKLLSLGAKPSEILTLTFTRAAAAEMLERILKVLARAAQSDEEAQKLHKDAELEKVPSKVDCAKWLFSMLDELPKLKISTYDSFFNDILRCFAFDMGLDAGINILEGTLEKRIREKALDDLLLDYREIQKVKEFYENFSSLDEQRELRRVGRDILEILDDFQNNSYLIPEEAVGNIAFRNEDKPDLSFKLKTVDGKNSSVVETLTRDLGLAFAYKKSIIDNSQVKKILESESIDFDAISDLQLTDSSLDHLERCLTYLGSRELKRKISETKAAYQLSEEYESKLLERKFRENSFTFSDITQTVGKIISNPILGLEIYFRLDSRIKHILIDEFQDTSWTQWDIMKPLIEEILSDAEGRSLFVVGDLKQAIYGWRGSSPEIFGRFLEYYERALKKHPMFESYRSAPEVLELVNLVFSLPCYEGWRDLIGFQDHVSAKGENVPQKGYSRLTLVSSEKRSENYLFPETLRLINEIQPHKQGLQAAVLVRTNEQAEKLLSLLTEENIPCTNSADVKIIDFPETKIILAFFKLIADPGDLVSLFLLRNSPLRELFKDKTPEEILAFWRRQVIRDGYSSVVARLAEKWKEISENEEEKIIIAKRLSDVSLAASSYPGRSISDLENFISFIEEYKRPREKADPGKVIVTTIHAAKGLTFDMVILPLVQSQLDDISKADYIKEEEQEEEVLSAPKCTAFTKKCSKQAYFASEQYAKMEEMAKGKQYIENANLNYVALTRPSKALYVLFPDAKKPGTSQLRYYLKKHVEGSKNSTEVFGDYSITYTDFGSANWYDEEAESKKPETEETLLELTPPAFDKKVSRRRQTVSPSKLGEKEREEEISDEMPFVAKERDEAMRRGSAIHAYCESILWLSDAVSAPAELASPDTAEAKAVIDAYIARHPENVFVKPAEECEVRREMPFMALVDEKLVKGIMDRVHFFPSAQAPERIVVYDFKTGHPHEENQIQIDLYAKVLKDIYGIEDITGELVYLEM